MTGAEHLRRSTARSAAALAIGLAVMAASGAAEAQLGMGQPGMGGPGFGQPPAKAPPKPPPGQETHAAPGAEDTQKIQTQEPSLPQDPLAIPPAVRKQIGTDADHDVETGRGYVVKRRFYGLWYSEESGSYRFRTLFPFWAERTMPNDTATLVSPLYYRRRSTNLDADVAFPFFWRLRDHVTRTTIVGPFMHREAEAAPGPDGGPARHDNWLAPFWFEGSSADGSGYFHVPPLLTFTRHSSHDGFNLVGPGFCKWKGGPSCDPRTTDSVDLGVAPFYFYGRDERSEYELIPPLLHYYKYSDVGDSSYNLWGPVLRTHSRESDALDVLPLFFHSWGKNEQHTTVFPLFHYGYKGSSNLLVTPLFLSATGDHGERTFATWGYARYRGRTELDMWTPLFWWYRDPDIDLDRKLFFPFFYRNTSPRSSDIAVFPLFGHFKRPAISETTWVTPFFRHTTDLTGWETDLYPLFYFGRSNASTHLVAAPFVWDFASPRSRATVILPAYYRFADDTTVSQLALNTYYHERKVRGGSEWEFHFFPLFSYGQSPTGHWWNVLYGLAGYTRDGTMSKMRALYIPIQLSE